MTAPRRVRVFFYVQHLLGIGHQVRAAAITRALQRRGMDVLYASGGFSETAHDLGGADIVQLPPVRAADATFESLLGASGQPIDDEWKRRRKEALLATFDAAKPDVLLIESFPFGRRQFRFELLPLLETAVGRIPIAASVRDILVAKNDPKRTQSVVDTVNAYFDAVIVHADPRIIRFGETFAGADAIADRTLYSGFVAPIPLDARQDERSGVIVSVGGGAVGGPTLRAAASARALTRLSDAPWRLVTGPNLPKPDRDALLAAKNVTIDTYIKNFRDILCKVAVSVSQAGYNTVMDLLATRTRSVLVPFSRHGETEQTRRATLLSQHNNFQMVAESELSAATLASAIDAALDAPPPDTSDIDLDGAARTAEIMAALASGLPFFRRL